MREIRPGDGEGCSKAWRAAGRHYEALVPEVLREPDAEGLSEWFERAILDYGGDDSLLLVAEEYRRKGAGTALMEAAENWGRES